jgi:hypothetical protein
MVILKKGETRNVRHYYKQNQLIYKYDGITVDVVKLSYIMSVSGDDSMYVCRSTLFLNQGLISRWFWQFLYTNVP